MPSNDHNSRPGPPPSCPGSPTNDAYKVFHQQVIPSYFTYLTLITLTGEKLVRLIDLSASFNTESRLTSIIYVSSTSFSSLILHSMSTRVYS